MARALMPCGNRGGCPDGGIKTLEHTFVVNNWRGESDPVQSETILFTGLHRGMWQFGLEIITPLTAVTVAHLPGGLYPPSNIRDEFLGYGILGPGGGHVLGFLSGYAETGEVDNGDGTYSTSWTATPAYGQHCVMNIDPAPTDCCIIASECYVPLSWFDAEGWDCDTVRDIELTIYNDGMGITIPPDYEAAGVPETTTMRWFGYLGEDPP